MIPLGAFIESKDFQRLADVDLGHEPPTAPGVVYYLRHWTLYGGPLPPWPYVLLTNFTDAVVDAAASRYLDDPCCQAWFAVNVVIHHAKLTPVPFGLRLTSLLMQVEPCAKDRWLYANFRVHSPWRAAAWRWATAQPWVTSRAPRKDATADYLQDVARARFVLCPEGFGPDTFRLWEAIALGAVPVVCGERLALVLAGLPHLTVVAWSDVTPDLLAAAWQAHEASFACGAYRLERLTRAYWVARLADARAAARGDR